MGGVINAIGTNLRRFLLEKHADKPLPAGLPSAIDDLAQASRRIAHLVNRSGLAGLHGATDNENIQGETQKKLDVAANDVLVDAVTWSDNWVGLASEEEDQAIAVRSAADSRRWMCVFDPLDGSSTIDVNGCVGTIFSILRCPDDVTEPTDEDLCQPGTAQIAAGFALYGPATMLVLTTGRGVDAFTLDNGSGEYLLSHPEIEIPADAPEFTVNMSNRRYWTPAIQAYVDDCMHGSDGYRSQDMGMRYVGSMVADVFRALLNGGIFLYPWDNRYPDRPGKLRLLYEANPMAFIVEQAGGMASTGTQRILEVMPESLHQRCPVFVGSRNEVTHLLEHYRQTTLYS